jgi:hypothetical protein
VVRQVEALHHYNQAIFQPSISVQGLLLKGNPEGPEAGDGDDADRTTDVGLVPELSVSLDLCCCHQNTHVRIPKNDVVNKPTHPPTDDSALAVRAGYQH